MKVAILVDGAFYSKRANHLFGEKSPEQRADELEIYCKLHLYDKHEKKELYRIFYYDCPPMERVVFHPFTKKHVNFSKSDLYKWMNTFLKKLKSKRKFALRLGKVSESTAHYNLKPEVAKALFTGKKTLEEITEKDFKLFVNQKGVDMRIGVDIASIAFKHQVEQIILIAGDSDFVPAAKLARREGIDFILDPMGNDIKEDLFEHIDGIRSKHKAYLKKYPKTEKIIEEEISPVQISFSTI